MLTKRGQVTRSMVSLCVRGQIRSQQVALIGTRSLIKKASVA